MRAIIKRHRHFWTQKHFILKVATGVALLFVSFLMNFYANVFALRKAGAPISDILLDRIPTINVDLFYSESVFFFIVALVIIHLAEPKWIPFTLKSISLFIIIRSFAMTLTHLAPPEGMAILDLAEISQKFSSGADLFFSGHTGLPFLMMFIFWQKKLLRWFFLIATVIGAATVLLGKLHYSIDVFSAFFIAFTIFAIAKKIFCKDYELGISSEVQ